MLIALAAARAQPVETGPDPSTRCEAAIRGAELRYQLPHGLLFAISLAESGRPDPRTSRLRPWPWSVQAHNTSYFFASRAEAVNWVRQARAQGVASIDTGCLQISMLFHPHAFDTLDHAFDPQLNADYGARFLVQLHAATNAWSDAIGFYHSRDPNLAAFYRQRVRRAMGLVPRDTPAPPPSLVARLSSAWAATMPTHTSTPVGRNWDSLLNASADTGAGAIDGGPS